MMKHQKGALFLSRRLVVPPLNMKESLVCFILPIMGIHFNFILTPHLCEDRIARGCYRPQAPSDTYVKVSLHTAQAFLRLSLARPPGYYRIMSFKQSTVIAIHYQLAFCEGYTFLCTGTSKNNPYWGSNAFALPLIFNMPLNVYTACIELTIWHNTI